MAKSVPFANKARNPYFPQVADIDPSELKDKMNDVLLVDVRRSDEFTGELGHIKGAKLITLDTLPQNIAELPQDQTIVFVCRSGGRSAQAAAFAQQEGLSDVYNMYGGMLRWNELGFEIEK